MSNTANEYENPGGNYPDREDAPAGAALGEGGDHQGQDGGRDTLTASEAQRADALGSGATQDLPAMAQNNATADEKVAGIVDQTRQDVGTESLERIQEVLRQRFDDAGIEVSDEFVPELAKRVKSATSGGSGV